MKKIILTMALILAVGFTGINSASAGWGGPGYCNGPGGWADNDTVTYEDMEKFRAETEELWEQLYEKRLEYFEVINREEPDKELAQTIWSEIYDLQFELHEKAVDYGLMHKQAE